MLPALPPNPDKLCTAVLNQYASLGRRGKPRGDGSEWTAVAAVLLTISAGGESEHGTSVIAMATGSKCIGRGSMSPRGDVLNDSHAEVIARRCFLRYLYRQVEMTRTQGKSEIFSHINEERKCILRPETEFHFFTSCVPCGDAAIFPKESKTDGLESVSIGQKRKLEVGEKFHKKIKNNLSTDDLVDSAKLEYVRSLEIASSFDNQSNQKCSDFCNYKDFKPVLCDRESNNVVGVHPMSLNVDGCAEKDSAFQTATLDSSVDTLKRERSISSVEIPDANYLAHDYTNTYNDTVSESNPLLFKQCAPLDELQFESCQMAENVGAVVNDAYRTGAKVVAAEPRLDAKSHGAKYHTALGMVRTKPGRGDPTLSVSCSDKLARWVAVGIQGALLSLLIADPVRLSSVTVGGGGPYCRYALHRALIGRIGSTQHAQPALLYSRLAFQHARWTLTDRARPCPSAIAWARLPDTPLEVAVDGRKQGWTKRSKTSGQLRICKLELLKQFVSLAGDTFSTVPYIEIKHSAVTYQEEWKKVKEKFGAWTVKPEYLTRFALADFNRQRGEEERGDTESAAIPIDICL